MSQPLDKKEISPVIESVGKEIFCDVVLNSSGSTNSSDDSSSEPPFTTSSHTNLIKNYIGEKPRVGAKRVFLYNGRRFIDLKEKPETQTSSVKSGKNYFSKFDIPSSLSPLSSPSTDELEALNCILKSVPSPVLEPSHSNPYRNSSIPLSSFNFLLSNFNYESSTLTSSSSFSITSSSSTTSFITSATNSKSPSNTTPKRRLSTTTPQPIKQYKCSNPDCTRLFTRRYNMKTHLIVHDDVKVKDFICSICTKGFTRKHDLTRHIKNRHEK